MTIIEKHKITPTQLTFFVIQTMVGVGVLSLPYNVHQWARGGAWISTILAGVLAQIVLIIEWALCKRHPRHTLYGIFTELSGKWLGKAVAVIYIVYFILICVLILLHFVDIVDRWVLIETPRWVILLLMTGTGLYLAGENTRIIARFYVPLTFMIVAFAILILFSYSNADIRYTFPITEAGWDNIFKAAHKAFVAMLGFEIILILFPFVSGSSGQILRAASLGNWMVVAFYTFLTFSSLIVFAPQEMMLVPEPLLFMMKAYSFRLIERIDLIFLSLWVVNVFTSFVTYIHLAAIGVQDLLGDRVNARRKSAGLIVIATYILALFISDPATMKMLDDWISNTGYIFFAGIPLLFLIISKVRGKERGRA